MLFLKLFFAFSSIIAIFVMSAKGENTISTFLHYLNHAEYLSNVCLSKYIHGIHIFQLTFSC